MQKYKKEPRTSAYFDGGDFLICCQKNSMKTLFEKRGVSL
ncbi:hypothetical protein HMPREF1234_0022 [Streptococcus pyogenes GA41039]|nr:hypothetical protein HMPREF1234_0022 [Streptococcus pyogenes GA41039]